MSATLTSQVLTGNKTIVPETAPVHKKPLKLVGVLNQFKSFEVTPVIGREYPEANLRQWLESPDSDALLRDLAITISRRGVVFFRKQDNLTNDLQKQLVQRLGELAGKPSTSKLHIHPVVNSGRTLGGTDNEISVLSSEEFKNLNIERIQGGQKQTNREGWHNDITFEPVPSDYAILRLTELPESGGDTLWASGYEVYDRISPPYQKFLESLSSTCYNPDFDNAAVLGGFKVYSEERGAPENVGDKLWAVHPVVRTNPVTGWKSIFPVGTNAHHINEVSEDESRHLMDWFLQLIMENHDLQVRHRWANPNDVAIWDNRSMYHTATFDYEGPRQGQRAVSLGERPYFDPLSSGRRAALAAEGTKV